MMVYGVNIDAGLMVFLEKACATYEERNINRSCSCLEFGSGLGMYSAYLKKHVQRHVVAIEPEPMGGTFTNVYSPWQSTVNIFNYDRSEYANIIKDLGGPFKLIFSIEVLEHVPLGKHADAAAFFYAAASPDGASLVFSAGSPHQKGTGHIGGRKADSWREILENAGFVYSDNGTLAAKTSVDSINGNHYRNIMVFYKKGALINAADPFSAFHNSSTDAYPMRGRHGRMQKKSAARKGT